MSAVLLAAALVVATGSVAALAAGDARLGLVGLAAALVGAGLVADPLPAAAILGVRLTAALLVVAVLRGAVPAVAARRRSIEPEVDVQPHLGWPAEVLLGLAGGVAGLAVAAGLEVLTPLGGTGTPAELSLGAGATISAAAVELALAGGLVAISLPALVSGAGLRRATAAVLAVEAALLARIGLAGPPAALEEVVLAVLLLSVAAAAALFAAAGRTAPEGSGLA